MQSPRMGPLTDQIDAQPPYDLRGPKNSTSAADGFHRPDLTLSTKVARDPLTGEITVVREHAIVVDRPWGASPGTAKSPPPWFGP